MFAVRCKEETAEDKSYLGGGFHTNTHPGGTGHMTAMNRFVCAGVQHHATS